MNLLPRKTVFTVWQLIGEEKGLHLKQEIGSCVYLSIDEGIVHTIAEGHDFFSLAWSKDSKEFIFDLGPVLSKTHLTMFWLCELAKP